MNTYYFGNPSYGTTLYFKVEATSLRRAIALFRAGTLFPHDYSDKPIKEEGEKHAFASHEGAVIVVRLLTKARVWEELARIPVEDDTSEATGRARQQVAELEGGVGEGEGVEVGTAIARATSETGLRSAVRGDLEAKQLALEQLQTELEAKKWELNRQMEGLKAELERRMEEIWLIELFLGSNEEVVVLREGVPADVATKISVRQRVLCMDEEIALSDWLDHPERIGTFNCDNLSDFDQWLLSDSAHLATVCPWPKGLVGLRVRRKERYRTRKEIGSLREAFGQAMQAVAEDAADKMTYLLVRNGEQLYRLWVDCDLWPRLFPNTADTEASEHAKTNSAWVEKEQREKLKQSVAGLAVLSGLVQRSSLYAPLPHPQINPFNPQHVDAYFDLIRDDEQERALGDGRDFQHLTWKAYQAWLKTQVQVGMRVLWTGRASFDKDGQETLQRHIGDWRGTKSNAGWPKNDAVYTLEPGDGYCHGAPFSFLYTPTSRWGGESSGRRLRYRVHADEVIPIDRLSWRVLKKLLEDPNERSGYDAFFGLAWRFYRIAKQEAEQERPFIDLVLTSIGRPVHDEATRARCERLLLWWKTKTKVHRTVNTDDAKALRMIVQALSRGQDAEDGSPERMLRDDVKEAM